MNNTHNTFFKILVISFVFIMSFSLATPSINISARRNHLRRRVYRIVYKHSKRSYLVGNFHHPIYILNWTDIKHFRNYKGAFRAKDDIYDLPVQIKNHVYVGKNVFDKVRFSRYYHHLNGWVYAGLISHSSKRGYYIGFKNLINNTLDSEIDYYAPRYLSQMKEQTFKDLNNDRKKNNVKPLEYNNQLDALARIRAQQISTNFSHYDNNGAPYTTDDAPLVNLPNNFQASENIASASLGNNRLRGSNKRYYNHNGYNMADMDNNEMMYHDQAEHNGHRYNILNPDNTLVGIGTAYNHRTRSFFVAEDFGNHDPISSENISSSNNN